MAQGGPGIRVEPATAERFDDVRAILAPRHEDGEACWCLYYRLDSAAFNRVRGPERRELLRELCGRAPAPGVVAYAADAPVGWCALGPRTEMGRLVRSRTIPKLDDRPVWSVVCFVVRAGHRRKGVAGVLLEGAVDYARACGAQVLEAYPIDTEGERVSGALAYVGTTGMFERAGFARVQETKARSAGRPRWLMRLELDPPSDRRRPER
jgi:GNAT superfamily N-acetyltransferase